MAFIEPDPYDLWLQIKRLFEERNGVLSSEYHAMAIRASKSGIPEDVYVNNFCFLADDAKVTAADDISAALIDFYDGANPNFVLNSYLHRTVTDLMTFKIYKLSDLKPREPVVRTFTTTVTRQSGPDLPEECAVCLSFSAAAPHTARRRGRIYFGPLVIQATNQDPTSGLTMVKPALQADLAAAAVRLANHVDAGWLIHSNIGAGTFSAVETGWVDNAFDTQRRRGQKATSRFTWSKS